MIGYVTLGTNDLERAAGFYDQLLAELGGKRVMQNPGKLIGWSNGKGAAIVLITPHDGGKASVGNGGMAALGAASQADVERVYNKAISLGARDEGEPGPRTPTFYAAYFRDPDGNKLNVHCIGAE